MAGLSVVTTLGGEEVQIGSKEWSYKVRHQAKVLAREIDTGYMKLAKILYDITDTKSSEPPYEPLYRAWGYNSFKDYAEEELNLKDRKAEYLRKIWYKLEIELDTMDPEVKKRLIAIGWSKMRLLVQDDVLSILNAEEWADRGEKSSFPALQRMIQQYKLEKAKLNGGGGLTDSPNFATEPEVPKSEPFRQRTFGLFENQMQVLDEALKKAAVLTGNPNAKPEQLLTLIATDFAATSAIGTGHDAQLKYVAKLEQQMGLKFIVVDPESKEVVYGIGTLEMLANKDG